MFTYQTVLLNRVFKTNEFIQIKPRVNSKTDRIIFVLPGPGQPRVNKLGGQLSKLIESADDYADLSDIKYFFDISPNEAQTIEESHKQGHDID